MNKKERAEFAEIVKKHQEQLATHIKTNELLEAEINAVHNCLRDLAKTPANLPRIEQCMKEIEAINTPS